MHKRHIIFIFYNIKLFFFDLANIKTHRDMTKRINHAFFSLSFSRQHISRTHDRILVNINTKIAYGQAVQKQQQQQ